MDEGADGWEGFLMSDDTLHVYASEHPHEEVYLAGTPDALRKVGAAIDRALVSKRPEFAPTFTADGEGFVVVVMPCDEMADTALPYAHTRTGEGRLPMLTAEDWARRREVKWMQPEVIAATAPAIALDLAEAERDFTYVAHYMGSNTDTAGGRVVNVHGPALLKRVRALEADAMPQRLDAAEAGRDGLQARVDYLERFHDVPCQACDGGDTAGHVCRNGLLARAEKAETEVAKLGATALSPAERVALLAACTGGTPGRALSGAVDKLEALAAHVPPKAAT